MGPAYWIIRKQLKAERTGKKSNNKSCVIEINAALDHKDSLKKVWTLPGLSAPFRTG